MFSASATRLLRITDLRARNYGHRCPSSFLLLFLALPLPCYASLLLLCLLFRLTNSLFLVVSFLPPPLPLPLPPPRPLLRDDSNAADIRPGSRPFYVNHVVKDPTPPLDLEEDRRTYRASSKGRRRGTTLKRTTALIAEEIRVPRTRCQGVYFEYRFLFSFILSSSSCFTPSLLHPFSFFFFLLVPPVRCSLSFVRPLWYCWPPRWY